MVRCCGLAVLVVEEAVVVVEAEVGNNPTFERSA